MTLRERMAGLGVAVLIGLAVLPRPAAAQAPGASAQAELRFDIARYRIEGGTLLPADLAQRLVEPFAGRGRSFADVKAAAAALERGYHERGYQAVQVYVPEQELDKGEVRLTVVEARIRRLEVRGNRHFSEANVRGSLPGLAEGRSPNAQEVSRNLAIANESPAKRTDVTLRAGDKDGDIDAQVDVTDEEPRKAFLTFDNTGTSQTGYYRLGIGYRHANLNDRDSALTLQFITSPDHLKDVGIYSVGYHVPLYAVGGSLDLVAAYSEVNAGTTQTTAGALTFSGRGGVLGARFNQHLDRLAGYDHRLVWSLDYRSYRNSCSVELFGPAGCGAAAATYSVLPLGLTYAGNWSGAASQTAFNVGWSANLGGGAYGGTSALGRARFGAKAGYGVLRYGVNHAQALPGDWQLRARLEGQHAREVLVPGEQFGIGGANSVRGFLEREKSDDRGHSASLEVMTPELLGTGAPGWNLRLLGFYDLGRTSRVRPQPGEQVHAGIASAGIGLRLAQARGASVRVDVANIRDAEGTRQRDHWRVALGVVLSF